MKQPKPKKFKWKTELRKVKDLKDHPNNPRTLTKHNHAELLKSFEEFDYVELVAINTDNTILAGHQRIHIMLELGWGEQEIEVRVPDKTLNENQCRAYLIRSNLNTGNWDFDLLANEWDTNELLSCGFEENYLLENFEIPKFDEEKEEDQPDLTETKKKVCPECGHEF